MIAEPVEGVGRADPVGPRARANICEDKVVPFSRIAENIIDQAMREGAFDDLPGRGQPLSLDDYFALPEDLRMAYSILTNANCAPPEVMMMQEIGRLERAVEAATHPDTRAPLLRQLRDRRNELAIVLERRAKPRTA